MSEPLGALCLVLHGHLPYVLNHGVSPHGEGWLYEAAAETYLPLLEMLTTPAISRLTPGITIGLTPILLEQLAHERFKTGFVTYLKERIELAKHDAHNFLGEGEKQLATLAKHWAKWFDDKLQHFERINRDIPGEFTKCMEALHIGLLTSAVTHAYLPLLLNDQMVRAQLRAGAAITQSRLGQKSTGVWLPECAYRPAADDWMPAVLYGDPRQRAGLESFLKDEQLNHFFVDTHAIAVSKPVGVMEKGEFHTVSEAQLFWDSKRGWKSTLQAVSVTSGVQPSDVYAFGRQPQVSEQVWSGAIGYPGAGEYLEFHKKHNERGLRYWKVTHNRLELHQKQIYRPEDVPAKIYEHVQHFASVIRNVLKEFKEQTGRRGVVVAPFDAELFGHWWFEGAWFLKDVLLTLGNDPSIELLTTEAALEKYPVDKVVRLPEGSWGESGNHGVWLNERTKWIWEIEYRAEGRFLKLLHELPWRTEDRVREMLIRGARELLLMQASDWPFVIHSRGADDYGALRFAGHATRFDRALTIAEQFARGIEMTEVQKAQVAEMDAHDGILSQIDLEWWM